MLVLVEGQMIPIFPIQPYGLYNPSALVSVLLRVTGVRNLVVRLRDVVHSCPSLISGPS